MEKYYRVLLNCARVYNIGSKCSSCGFINIMPLKGTITKKSIFGKKYIPTIEYKGKYLVIAKQVDDHLEDIVLNRKISFDPNGIQDITKASFDELMCNLTHGLSCYSMVEIEPEIAEYYKNIIESDINILNKYEDELSKIARKENVINELVNRLDNSDTRSDKDNNKNVKKRVLGKSA